MDWLTDLIRRVLDSIPTVPNAKWIVLGLAIAAILAVAARIVLGRESEERRRRARSGSFAGIADPWLEAERLAAAGNFTDAAHLLYRGVTERLAAAELIRLHVSKTSGDYARELRQRGSLAHAEFRLFGRRYERALFGLGTCDGPTYEALRDLAQRITSRGARAA